MKSASSEAIAEALASGELATYLGGLTPDQQAQERRVAQSVDRISAAAYGLTPGQASMGSARDSTWFAAERSRMTPEQRAKLEWVESATPEDVYRAEQAGELKDLVTPNWRSDDEGARLDAIRQQVTEAMTGGRSV